ncbi:uncharacterized protein LOC124820420 [Vigna umbellata]|uniref:uncharacterized protein LOC124820420 n=1 Tax=Vigna umbellata TaxID=87088 RepID=UPI001F5E5567|nr:uncharacterized protein LOC124820420 [Vigna umbellata]
MAHLLTPPPTTAAAALSSRARKTLLYSQKNGNFPTSTVSSFGPQYQQSQPSSISDLHQVPSHRGHSLHRRTLMGLSGAVVVGLGLLDEQRASGAARRPPPPPPTEKKDPGVSGVMAKILASKRRKEAMKEEVDKLRARGKPVNKDAPPPPPPPE